MSFSIIRVLGILPIIMICCNLAHADNNDRQIWSTVNLNTAISDRISANLELQLRFTHDASFFGQSFIRPSFTYKLNDVFSASVGYASVLTREIDGDSFSEERPWQQIGYLLLKSDGGITFNGRTRLEQRFINGCSEIGSRIRQQFRFEATLSKKTPNPLLWSETFYNLNSVKCAQRDGFDRTRNFIGLSLPLTEKSSLEAGYLNQVIFRLGKNWTNHILSVTLNTRF